MMRIQLWALLRPEVRRAGRQTMQWGELGFQGADPATDFRAMGTNPHTSPLTNHLMTM